MDVYLFYPLHIHIYTYIVFLYTLTYTLCTNIFCELTRRKRSTGRVKKATGPGGERSPRIGPATAVQCWQLHYCSRVAWRSECYYASWQSAPAPGPCSKSGRFSNSSGCSSRGRGCRRAHPNATSASAT